MSKFLLTISAALMFAAALFILALTSAFNSANADEYGLNVSFASYHTVDNNYNELNPGVGITFYSDDMDSAYQFGGYKNSEGNNTVYLAYKFYGNRFPYSYERVRPFFLVGLATGYEAAPVVIYPAIGADITVVGPHNLNVLVAPLATSDKRYGVVFGFQYEYRFKD